MGSFATILDYRKPIGKTRDEICMMPIQNGLFCTNSAILLYMLTNPDQYRERYPMLDAILAQDSNTIWKLGAIFNHWEMLEYLRGSPYPFSKEKFDSEDYQDYLAIREQWDPVKGAPSTAMLGAFRRLLEESIVKELYLYDDLANTDKALQYLIFTVFEDWIGSGRVKVICTDRPNNLYLDLQDRITTCILQDESDLYSILTSEKLKTGTKCAFLTSEMHCGNYTIPASDLDITYSDPRKWTPKHSDYYDTIDPKKFQVGTYQINLLQGGLYS